MKLLGSLSRDDLKKICGDNFPQWISFPAFEQVLVIISLFLPQYSDWRNLVLVPLSLNSTILDFACL